jgi:F-type H+-transporting ATPase subunit delta
MSNQILVKRYCLGLLGTIHNAEEYGLVSKEVAAVAELLGGRKDLADLLLTPFLPASRKVKVAGEVLKRLDLQPKTERFVLLLLENERLGLLPDIVALLPDLWNESRGIVTFEVSSVVPLSGDQKAALRRKLEKIEGSPVALKYRQDPSLIGGLSLRKGNMVYDASIRSSLEKIKEKIIEG